MLSSKYVKDYRMDTSVDDRGKTREEMVYIGPLYCWDMPEEVFYRLKRQYLAGSILAWLVFVASLWPYSEISRIWYVILPYCCLLFPLFFISVAVHNMISAPCPFSREKKDKTVGRLKGSFMAGMVLSGGAAVGQAAGCLLMKDEHLTAIAITGTDVLMIAATWLLFIIMLYGFKASKRLAVREIENPRTAEWMEDKYSIEEKHPMEEKHSMEE